MRIQSRPPFPRLKLESLFQLTPYLAKRNLALVQIIVRSLNNLPACARKYPAYPGSSFVRLPVWLIKIASELNGVGVLEIICTQSALELAAGPRANYFTIGSLENCREGSLGALHALGIYWRKDGTAHAQWEKKFLPFLQRSTTSILAASDGNLLAIATILALGDEPCRYRGGGRAISNWHSQHVAFAGCHQDERAQAARRPLRITASGDSGHDFRLQNAPGLATH